MFQKPLLLLVLTYYFYYISDAQIYVDCKPQRHINEVGLAI